MIKLLRCDDRLIHGQCVTSIVKKHDIARIIVIDDFTASNQLLKRIFASAVPNTIHVDVLNQTDAVDAVKEASADDVNTLVLMRVPSIILRLYENVEGLDKDFNIANVAVEKGTINVTNYARFDEAELEAVKKIADMGVHVWFNQVPGTPITEWDSVKEKY